MSNRLTNRSTSHCFSFDDLVDDELFDSFEGKNNTGSYLNATSFLDHVFDGLAEKFERTKTDPQAENPLVRKEKSYFFNNYTCFFTNQTRLVYLNVFQKFRYLIFAFQHGVYPYFSQFVHHKKSNTSNLIMLKLHKFRGQTLPYPYTNCDSSLDDKASRFSCLNSCFKKVKKISSYLYRYKDNEIVDLKDKCINKKKEKECYKRCSNFNNCVLDYYMSISYSSNEDEDLVQEYVNSIYVGFSMSSLEFYIQLVGLISLFFSMNVFKTLPGLIKLVFVFFKLEKSIIYEKYFYKIRLAVIVLIFLSATALSLYILFDYFFRSEIIKTKLYNFSSGLQPFSIVFCIPVQFLLFDSENFTLKQDQNILKNYDFNKIDALTRNGNRKLISRAVVTYGSREKKLNYRFKDEPLFIFTRYKFIGQNDKNMIDNKANKPSKLSTESNMNLLSRCFRLEPNIIEPRYRSLVTISTLNIDLKHLFIKVYVVIKEQKFILNASFLYLNEYKLLRKYKSSSICMNYNSTYHNCESRVDCINQCINDEFVKKHQSLPSNTVVNQQIFKNKDSQLLSYHFNRTIDEDINEKCENRFKLNDCKFNFYTDSLKPLVSFLANSKKSDYYLNMTLDLYYVETEENETSPTMMKMMLSIFNVESIFFSVSVVKALNLLLMMVREPLKISHLKAYQYSINVICLTCLLTHFSVIFYSLIDDNLMTSAYYLRNETAYFPDEIFCIHVDQDLIDPNYELTGEYLEHVTANLTFETVFEKLVYVKKNRLGTIDFREFKNENENFKTFTVFYHHMKCLILRTYIRYDVMDFSFIEDPLYAFPIGLYLNRSFDRNTNIYFLSKKAGSYEFTELNLLEIKDVANRKFKYQIRHELLEVSINDQFTFIKNPLSLFYKSTNLLQATAYLMNMKENFQQKYHHSSLFTVEIDKSSLYKIDDDLFHQFYLQEQIVIDRSYPSNPNSVRQIFNNYIQFSKIDQAEGENEADFDFFCSFFVLKTEVTNKDSLAKLIQQILNSLSTWFNICLLDLHAYLFKLFYIFSFVHQTSIRLKYRLKLYFNNL